MTPQAKKLPSAFAALIAKSAKEQKELKYGEGGDELIVKINSLPSVAKRTEAIEMASDLLFSFESGIDGYIPSLLTFARKYAVLVCFTDINFNFDLSDIWTVVNATELYSDVVREVGEDIVAEFLLELKELVEAYKGARIHSINLDAILERLGMMINGFSSQFKKLDMVKVLEGFSNMPKDLKGDDFVKQIISLAKGGT